MLETWINGSFVPVEQARISALDAGLQHGVGLFETMCARNGRIFRGLEHATRLCESAIELGLAAVLDATALDAALAAVLSRNALSEVRVRLTVTGGDLNLLSRGAAQARRDPTIVIQVQPPTEYPPELFSQGVAVRVADARLNMLDPFAGHKTLWYWPRLHALQAASAAGLHEALWFDVSNALSSGCVSNVFLVKDGVLQTPIARGEEPGGGLRSTTMPGITRKSVLELAREQGLEVRVARLDVGQVLEAEEVFLTNSSWQLLPVVRVEQREIAGGEPGPVAKALRRALLERIERETAAQP